MCKRLTLQDHDRTAALSYLKPGRPVGEQRRWAFAHPPGRDQGAAVRDVFAAGHEVIAIGGAMALIIQAQCVSKDV